VRRAARRVLRRLRARSVRHPATRSGRSSGRSSLGLGGARSFLRGRVILGAHAVVREQVCDGQQTQARVVVGSGALALRAPRGGDLRGRRRRVIGLARRGRDERCGRGFNFAGIGCGRERKEWVTAEGICGYK
jgi:hypothetical protein